MSSGNSGFFGFSTADTILTIEELDGAPSLKNLRKIFVSNGTLTDNGDNTAALATGGGGSSPDIYEDGVSVVTGATRFDFKDMNVENPSGTIGTLYHNLPNICDGRLTLTTATPITTANVTAAGTLYFTPYNGNKISLYDGTRWKVYPFTECSLALSVTSGTNYDVYLYDNAGTLTLDLTAWTNDTTRATALTTQDGVYVKTGATTRRYLGTIRASGANTTEDSDSKRFVWNYYNRTPFEDMRFDSTNSWTDAGNGTWSAINSGNATWKHEFVIGLDEYKMVAEAHLHAAVLYIFAVALDSATSLDRAKTTVCMDNDVTAGSPMIATWCAHSGIGYHYLQGIETTYNASAATAYGDNGGVIGSSGQGFMNSGFLVEGWR